jgi:hypothetical protein
MRKLQRIILGTLSVVGIVGLLLACDNPFDNSLGEKVNITPPEIAILDPTPGAFISDNAVLTGRATDDRKVSKIEVGIYANISAGDVSGWSTEGIVYDGSSKFTFTIDTTTLNGGIDGTV